MKTTIRTAYFAVLLACVLGIYSWNVAAEDNTRSWTIDGNGSITRNEDGTYTFNRSGRTAFEDGRVATHTAQRLVKRGEDGSATWTGNRSRTNPKGETIRGVTQGSRTVTKRDDGSRVISIGETVTLSDGRIITINGQRIVVRNEDGTLAWTAEHSASRSDGATASRSATGSGVRSGDNFNWQRSAEGVNFRGLRWSAETTGGGRKTDEGRTWNSSTSGHSEGGVSVSVNRQGTWTRDGGTVNVTGSGSRTAR